MIFVSTRSESTVQFNICKAALKDVRRIKVGIRREIEVISTGLKNTPDDKFFVSVLSFHNKDVLLSACKVFSTGSKFGCRSIEAIVRCEQLVKYRCGCWLRSWKAE